MTGTTSEISDVAPRSTLHHGVSSRVVHVHSPVSLEIGFLSVREREMRCRSDGKTAWFVGERGTSSKLLRLVPQIGPTHIDWTISVDGADARSAHPSLPFEGVLLDPEFPELLAWAPSHNLDRLSPM